MCQKSFKEFHAGDFSLNNVPQSSRQEEIENGENKGFIRE